MIHYTTTNQSAIKMSLILEEMGIKNNAFFLELLDEDLLNVDPFSEDLTLVQKAKITNEIINNIWYYLREIVRIPTGGGLSRFEFHRGNIALTWAIINNISSFVIWPRQTYKTTTCCAIYSHFFYWGSTHNKICYLAHEDAATRKNLKQVKDIRDNLPEWLNLSNSKKDRDNEKEMYNDSIDNQIICRAPARNEDAARKSGRGLSTPMQFFDEVAFIPYIYDMYDSIAFAYAEVARIAKRNNTPYHQIMATTAGFLNTKEGQWAYKFLNSCADFTEVFYDMDIDKVKNIISNTSTSDFLNLSFMYYDLSKGDDYLEDQKKRVANSLNPKDTLDREVLNVWKDISTEHPLGQDRIDKLVSLVKQPTDYIVINDTYTLRVYVDVDKFDWTQSLIGAMDISGNLKNDFSTLTILNQRDGSVVAVLRTNSQSTTLFAMGIVAIMRDLCPNLVLFPERNYNGAVIDLIVSHLDNSRRRVYHEDDEEDRPGLFNSKKVRPILFNDILKMAIDEHGHKIYDKNIIGEICGLIRTRAGRIDHKQGEHDDTLISYLLAWYFILYIQNIHLYIDKSTILSQIDSNMIVKNKDDVSKNAMIMRKRNIMDNSYLQLLNKKTVSSIDDICDIMMSSSNSTSVINSSLSKIDSSKHDEVSDIERYDSLKEVRSDINKLKEDQALTEVFVENTGVNLAKQTSDFKSVFGW